MKIGPYKINRVHQGDALECLKRLPDESIQCCITSPPYFGLRDYGTASWEGGDPACDHKIPAGENDPKYGESRNENSSHTLRFNRVACHKCGAKRIDRQIGIEETPQEYVGRLVAVFREVKRVLRKDGTFWLNLGQSYDRGDRPKYSGDKNRKGGLHQSIMDADGYGFGGTCPSQSPLLWRVPACDTDDKALPDSQAAGRACPDSYDGHRGGTPSRRGRNAHNDRSALPSERQTSQTGRDTAPADCGPSSPDALLPCVRASTTPQSYDQPLDVSGLSDGASASQQEPQTSLPDAPLSADMTACTSGTSPLSLPLVVHTRGKESFFSACQSPDCNGIGYCGLCWCRLAIPSLNIKAKDEINIPHLVAMALQADGWILRQTICWHKPNPMPESVTDRCTKAHEYVFLMTKSTRYFYDAEAIKEPASENFISVARRDRADFGAIGTKEMRGTSFGQSGKGENYNYKGPFRNRRSVWTIASQPYQDAHFATFPPNLIKIPIKAGTSEEGCCSECGTPWRRVVEREPMGKQLSGRKDALGEKGQTCCSGAMTSPPESRTIGWEAACKCSPAKVVPCIVLDPFAGSGTTLAVAQGLKRVAIGFDLNEKYAKDIAAVRLESARTGMKAAEVRAGQMFMFEEE